MAHQEQDKMVITMVAAAESAPGALCAQAECIDSSLILLNTHTCTSWPSKHLQGNDYPTLVSSSSKKKKDASSSSTNQPTAGDISGKQVTEIIIKWLELTWRQLVWTRENKMIPKNLMEMHVILMEHWKMPQRWNGQTHHVLWRQFHYGHHLLNEILMSWVMRKMTLFLPSFWGYALLFIA